MRADLLNWRICICEPTRKLDATVRQDILLIVPHIFLPDPRVPQMFVSIRQARDRLYSWVHGMLDNVAEINVTSESVVVWTFQTILTTFVVSTCSFIFYFAALNVNSLRIAHTMHSLLDFAIPFILWFLFRINFHFNLSHLCMYFTYVLHIFLIFDKIINI